MSEWIKIKDEKPPIDKDFLGYVLMGYYPLDIGAKDYRKRDIVTCTWNGERFIENCHCSGYEHDREYMEVTHWMPLPSIPKEKEKPYEFKK